MYVKCTLMVLEHLNEVTLIQEWLEQGIKVRLSVEWFYTTSVVVDGVEWIADPVFSNICVLNDFITIFYTILVDFFLMVNI